MLMGAVYFCFLDSSGYRKGPLPFETEGFYLLCGMVDCVYLFSGWMKMPSKTWFYFWTPVTAIVVIIQAVFCLMVLDLQLGMIWIYTYIYIHTWNCTCETIVAFDVWFAKVSWATIIQESTNIMFNNLRNEVQLFLDLHSNCVFEKCYVNEVEK